MKFDYTPKRTEIPKFLIRTTMGCSLLIVIFLTPFFIADVIDGNLVLSLCIGVILFFCLLNAYLCYRGEYHLGLNFYVVSPIAVLTVCVSIYYLGRISSYWAFPISLSFYFVLPEKRGALYNGIMTIIVIVLMWRVAEPAEASRFSAALIGTSLFMYLSTKQIYRLHAQLKQKAIHDELTGLLNRSTLAEELQHAIAHGQRACISMTLISLDIDHFKQINDTYGHAFGDEVLRKLGQTLKQRLRKIDKVFRTGGEEFLILAYNTNYLQGQQLAEKLRHYLAKSLSRDDLPITVSLGISELEPDMDQESWLKKADEKLYAAKHQGRNQVAV